MNVTKQQLAMVLAMIEAHWHASEPIPEEAHGSYLRELGEFDAEHVVAAVEAMIRRGHRFVPLAGEIRAEVIRLRLDPPDWATAMRMLFEASKRKEEWRAPDRCLDANPDCDGDGNATREVPYPLRGLNTRELAKETRRVLGHRAEVVSENPFEFEEELRRAAREAAARLFKSADERPMLHTVAYRCSCASRLRLDREKTIELPPILLAFARLIGWAEIERLLGGDRNVEAQVRTKYDQFVAQAVESASLASLNVGAELPRVVRSRALDATLDQLDYQKALPGATVS